MDYEHEKVLKLVFPDECEEILNGDNAPEVIDYMFKLGSYKVDQLKKETNRLQEECKQNVEQTQELAVNNYKTFIQTAECSREIYQKFVETEQRVESLSTRLPEFTATCNKFLASSSNINSARRLNSLTLTRNAELLEILEIPQLMESCIREGRYEETLELAAYVQRIGNKHGGIPVIASIQTAVEAAWHTMLVQLLSQLRTDLQLPKCLQVVGYLRRMQAFTTAELKLKFLQIRTNWFKELLAKIPQDDAHVHLTKTIDATRVHLFNIITQYRAIFPEDEDTSSGMTTITSNLNAPDGNKIFQSWLHDRIVDFINTLEKDLASNEINSFDTILGQCMYFGLSFSRVGVDFRSLIAPVFIRVISLNFQNAIVKITQQFEQDIEQYTLINKVPIGINRTKSSDKSDNGNHPPESLLDFTPLAIYCNGVLTVFNELRLCAPIALAPTVTQVLEGSLENVCKNVLSFYRQEQQAFTPSEREYFIRFCSCFAYDLVPYLQRCIHFIFPPTTIASYLGINVLALQKHGLTYFRQKKILEPIERLLPDRIETVIRANVGTGVREREEQSSVPEGSSNETSISVETTTG
ncbi:conserved oligomeric Golgi complex subunit 8 [Toxorhynchites rutilus septentrionalis]|uniref:conserved oligomeric Golgi complex subunit 8 n=1 Tax=Toxorhynchites rutilus septentrionalis TaxID=329112 RepID=UPI00247AD902|nr:conserved oligomeric Golgi complex subunit 8 [Toxorhynchites rutilus septentrionalis]